MMAAMQESGIASMMNSSFSTLFTEALQVSIGIPRIAPLEDADKDDTEEIRETLKDVLYSLEYDKYNNNDAGNSLQNSRKIVLEAFNTSEESEQILLDSETEKQTPRLNVSLEVLEADELKPKRNEATEAIDVYCIIKILDKSTKKSTVKCCKQNNKFSLPQWKQCSDVVNITPREKLFATIEVWQEVWSISKKPPFNMKSREDKIIGQTCIDISVPPVNNYSEWHDITTRSLSDGNTKVQGKVHIKIIHEMETKSLSSNFPVYKMLFDKFSSHQINSTNEGQGYQIWDGSLSPQLKRILDHFVYFYNLSPSAKALAHWRVVAQMKHVDYEYVLNTLKILKPFTSTYSECEKEDVKLSMNFFVDMCEAKLKALHFSFPLAPAQIERVEMREETLNNTKRTSRKQLTFILRCLDYITKEFHHLAPLTNHDSAKSLVASSLKMSTYSSWEMALHEQENNIIINQNEQCLVKLYEMTDKCGGYLKDVKDFYSPIFLKEMDISHLSISYQVISEKLSEHIKPILEEIYNDEKQSKQDVDWWKKQDPFCLEPRIGNASSTPSWNLYEKLRSINKLCEGNGNTDLASYHTWFIKGFNKWIEQSVACSEHSIHDSLEKDEFYKDNSSILESMHFFDIWKNNWAKFGWSDIENSHEQQDLVIRALIKLANHYMSTLDKVLETCSKNNQRDEYGFPSMQLCVTINCLEKLQQKMKEILGLFKIDINDHKLMIEVNNCVDEIQKSILDYMDNNTTQLLPTLISTVEDCCSNNDVGPLLGDLFVHALRSLLDNLYHEKFQQFLGKLWEAVLKAFKEVIDRKLKGEYDTNFFKDMQYVLKKTYEFFTSGGNDHSLGVQEAETQDYVSLVESLENMSLTTAELLACYYNERGDQVDSCKPIATVHARAYFINSSSKLEVEVSMTNITVAKDTMLKNYYKISLVPKDLFSDLGSHTTNVECGTKDVVYDGNTFQFELCKNDERVKHGSLLLTLMQSSKLKDRILGDAVIPLKDLPEVKLVADRFVPTNKYFVTKPLENDENPIVKALAIRTWDTQAVEFIKRQKKVKRPSETRRMFVCS